MPSKNTFENDFYEILPQSVKDSIEKGIAQIEAGEIYEHDWVMQEITNKFGLTFNK